MLPCTRCDNFSFEQKKKLFWAACHTTDFYTHIVGGRHGAIFNEDHKTCQLCLCDRTHVQGPCFLELNRLENTSDKKFARVPDAKDIPPPVSRVINVFLTTFSSAAFIFKRSGGGGGKKREH